MVHFGLYEVVVKKALEAIHPAPWSIEDLEASESWITPEHCQGVYPRCDPQDVTDWLHALPKADRQELVDHLNAEQGALPNDA